MGAIFSICRLKRLCFVETSISKCCLNSISAWVKVFSFMRRRDFIRKASISTILLFVIVSNACYAGLPDRTGNNLPKPKRIMPQTKPFTVTGEVIDVWCYCSQVMGSGRGEQHKACALACAHGGVTLGIVADRTGEVYIAAKYRGYQGCKDLLLPYVAKHVKVAGWLAQRGGCNVLKIKSVESVK